MLGIAGFCEIHIHTTPVSKEYEEKWGGQLTVGEYIMSAKIFAKKPVLFH